MSFNVIDKRGSRKYPTGDESREHIVPIVTDENGNDQEGIPFYRERLAAYIGGEAIRDVFLYQPDTKAVTPSDSNPIVKFGGLFTNGNLYFAEAAAEAQSGRQFATFITNSKLPLRVQLLDRRHRESPYLRTAQNGKAVIDAVRLRTGFDKVDTSGHSYAGMTMSEMLAYYGENVDNAVFQDPAGISGHHLQLKELFGEEVGPALPFFLQQKNMPRDYIKNTLRHIYSNPVLRLRELADLGLGHPNMRPSLEIAKDKGVKVGLMILGRSAIFDAVRNRSLAEADAMFDLVDDVPEAGHIDPNTKVVPIVAKQNEMLDSLSSMHKLAA